MSLLSKLAKRSLETRKSILSIPRLGAFIPQTSPKLVEPYWLAPLLEALDKALEEPTNIIINVPPQYGKSLSVKHAVARALLLYPDRTHAYCSYASDFSKSQSYDIRRIYHSAGGRLDQEVQRREEWRVVGGGGVIATGVGGPLTGMKVDGLLIIDDPHKDHKEAYSKAYREQVWNWYQDVADTRTHATTSKIVVQTRWHIDDLTGRLLKYEPEDWIHIKILPFDEDGESICPHQPTEKLLKRKKNARTWQSMYMQDPNPPQGRLFQEPATCHFSEIPKVGQKAIGLDLSYSVTTHSDYSVLVVLLKAEDKYWVLDLVREQSTADVFTDKINLYAKKHGCGAYWYTATTEKGVASLISKYGARVTPLAARADKYTRALPLSDAWNSGDVVIPIDQPWSDLILGEQSEVLDFSGVNDASDDIVDALVAAFDQLAEHNSQTGGYGSVGQRQFAIKNVAKYYG